jgi:AICAR transformylase/IMP cyclohydrolase PurH
VASTTVAGDTNRGSHVAKRLKELAEKTYSEAILNRHKSFEAKQAFDVALQEIFNAVKHQKPTDLIRKKDIKRWLENWAQQEQQRLEKEAEGPQQNYSESSGG